MNGYDLAERILGQTNYDVLPMIELAGGAETDWLEFKAASLPRDGIFKSKGKKQENKWDYRWDISKALVGMANHVGGALLLGVAESDAGLQRVEAVGLENCDFNDDRDRFMRDILRPQLISPQDGWRTGTSGHWFCAGLEIAVTPRWGSLFDKPVVVLLVRPRKADECYLKAQRSVDGINQDVVLRRAQGEFGRTSEVSPELVEDWWGSRTHDRVDLDQLFLKFIDLWTADRKKPDDETDRIIKDILHGELDYTDRQASVFSSSAASYFESEAEDVGGESTGHRVSRQKVSVVLETRPRSVLLGEPGSGKSTCFRHVTASLARNWLPGRRWGIFVELNAYRELGLRATILQLLGNKLYWIDIEHRFANGEIVLFLDALNECPVGHYVECCQEISSLLNLYPQARIHISSRSSHNPSQFRLPAFRIQSMSLEEQRRFLEICTGNPERVADILRILARQPGAKHLAGSPILLRILGDIGEATGESLPSGLAMIYKQFLQHWFKREAEKHFITGTPSLWSFPDFVEALASLAFQMRAEGRVACTMNFARQCVAPIIGVDHLAKFLEQMSQGLLLNKDQVSEMIRFSHEMIQEFFAAEHLARHPQVLKGTLTPDGVPELSSSWLMPLVFAFELIDPPPPGFLEAAWAKEPLLTAVALRSDAHFLRLKVKHTTDPWLRGVLRTLRGEDSRADERELAFSSRVPPKYKLPVEILSALESEAFWYAGTSHPAGEVRQKFLRQLLLDRNSMWIEGFTDLAPGLSHWIESMSPAQKCLAGIDPNFFKRNPEELASVTLIELCALLRNRRITEEQFSSQWQSALERGDDEHLETNLLALLRIAAKIKTKGLHINIQELGKSYREPLCNLGLNWHLSLRLLNLLKREGFINYEAIKNDSGRIADIVERMSPMNMYRFLKSGLVQRSDIPAARIRELGNELKPDLAQELVNKKYLRAEDIAGARLSASELGSEEGRNRIKMELANKAWDVKISKILNHGEYGFVEHPKLNDGAFCYFDRIDNPNGRTFRVGDKLRVVIELKAKKDRWGYAVKSGEFTGNERFS